MHTGHVCIDFVREDQVVMNGFSLVHQSLVRVVQLLIGAGIHAIGFEQTDLRFELAQFSSTDVGKRGNGTHYCQLILCINERTKLPEITCDRGMLEDYDIALELLTHYSHVDA